MVVNQRLASMRLLRGKAQGAPGRRGARLGRIAPHEQQLQLARLQHSGGLPGGGPEGELASRQPLAAQPKSLPVVDQDLDGRASAVAEDEQRPAEWVSLQAPSAGPRQSVDAGTEIDRLDRHQNAHVRRERDHGALRKPLHTPAKLARPAPLSSTRIVAPRPF